MAEVWVNLVLALVFIAIDCTYFVLSAALNWVLRMKSRVVRSKPARSSERRKRVVIVGAGFAGLRALQILRTHFRCTLIDRKDFFEYTPGILRAVVRPSYLSRLVKPLPPDRIGDSVSGGSENAVTFVHGDVMQLQRRAVVVRGALSGVATTKVSSMRHCATAIANNESNPVGGATIPRAAARLIEYDYLLLGSGSSYAAPIKPASTVTTLAERRVGLDAGYARLRSARTVLIIGAGLVGVELVGELLHFCSWLRRVIVTDMSPVVCAQLPATVRCYLQGWLERQPRCELVLGVPIAGTFPRLDIDAGGCTLADGRRLCADMVFRCTGGRADASYATLAAAAPATPSTALRAAVNDVAEAESGDNLLCGKPVVGIPTTSGALQVDAHLRVLGANSACSALDPGRASGTGMDENPSTMTGCARDMDIFLEVICKECAVTRERAAAAFRENGGDVPTTVLTLMREASAAQAGREAPMAPPPTEPLDGGHVFAMGDCAWHDSVEPKLGHTAELNAELVAHNIMLATRGRRLLSYPSGVVGSNRTPRIYCVSLGPYQGSLYFNGLVINGRLPAIIKHVLELTKVAASGGDALGIWFWEVADAVANFVGRSTHVLAYYK
eukprot:g2576.t1